MANNYYRVDKDGKAPSGLKAGDYVVTGGGTYKITGGSYGNYTSEKVDSNTNTWTYKGSYATPNSSGSSGKKKPSSNGSSGGGSSTGGSKTNTNTNSINKPINNVTTNTSYNGGFLTVDLNEDYTRLANEAASRGDYTSAARYEAMRNAKVNYLNSTNQNPNGYDITSNYVKDYGYKNNQGGQIFTDNASSISDLKDNWTSATVNGIKYTKDSSGNIYSGGVLVGDGFNANTGEMTFSNSESAKKAAYDRYLSVVNDKNLSGLNQQQSYDYLDNKGIVDTNYINAIQQGTVGDYMLELERQAQAQIDAENFKKQLAALANQEEEVERKPISQKPVQTPIAQVPTGEVTQEEQVIIDDNSFETDVFAPSRLTKQEEYERAKRKFNNLTRWY